jgi:hypothetical protein
VNGIEGDNGFGEVKVGEALIESDETKESEAVCKLDNVKRIERDSELDQEK